MVNFLFSFIISFIVNLLIIKLSSRIDKLVTDHLHDGPQKFHDRPTPRIGGVGVFIAFSLAAFYAQVSENNNYSMLLISSLPVFLFGVLEDVLKKINQSWQKLCRNSQGNFAGRQRGTGRRTGLVRARPNGARF